MQLPPQLARPAESVLTPRFPCSCRGAHSGAAFARAFRRRWACRAIPFIIRTYEKHGSNPFRIRTSKTQDLKPFRMSTYRKTGVGGGDYC